MVNNGATLVIRSDTPDKIYGNCQHDRCRHSDEERELHAVVSGTTAVFVCEDHHAYGHCVVCNTALWSGQMVASSSKGTTCVRCAPAVFHAYTEGGVHCLVEEWPDGKRVVKID